jgi:hypothetical protein
LKPFDWVTDGNGTLFFLGKFFLQQKVLLLVFIKFCEIDVGPAFYDLNAVLFYASRLSRLLSDEPIDEKIALFLDAFHIFPLGLALIEPNGYSSPLLLPQH